MPLKKEPLIVQCFKCEGNLMIKFVPPRRQYSQKNNWGYWTEISTDQEKYICWNCLSQFYYQEHPRFLETVKSEKKKKLLRVYLSVINSQLEN